jgi:hypothetical protein
MSDDNFKDHNTFHQVPAFTMNVTDPESTTPEYVKPSLRPLGQIKDYSMVKITTAFSFNDKKFMKTSGYKIPKPGHVWDN